MQAMNNRVMSGKSGSEQHDVRARLLLNM